MGKKSNGKKEKEEMQTMVQEESYDLKYYQRNKVQLITQQL